MESVGIPSPTPLSRPTAQATEAPFVINWTEAAQMGDEMFLYGNMRLRAFNGRFLALVGDTAMWTSRDALTWRPGLDLRSPGGWGEITDFAVGDSRVVAVGRDYDLHQAVTWISNDGDTWQRAADPPVELDTIGATSSGFIAVGGERLWRSLDGSAWAEATDATSQQIAAGIGRLFTIKGETVAFVRGGRHVEVWQTMGAEWTKLGELPGSGDAYTTHATRGPRGWLAFTWDEVYVSETGTSWERVDPEKAPQQASIGSVIALDAGFVAVGWSGERGDVTCGTGEPLVGHTWTSTDGLRWAEMEQSIPGAALTALYARDQTLYVLGGKSVGEGAVWTAPLPPVVRSVKGVEPFREPGHGGCGP